MTYIKIFCFFHYPFILIFVIHYIEFAAITPLGGTRTDNSAQMRVPPQFLDQVKYYIHVSYILLSILILSYNLSDKIVHLQWV